MLRNKTTPEQRKFIARAYSCGVPRKYFMETFGVGEDAVKQYLRSYGDNPGFEAERVSRGLRTYKELPDDFIHPDYKLKELIWAKVIIPLTDQTMLSLGSGDVAESLTPYERFIIELYGMSDPRNFESTLWEELNTYLLEHTEESLDEVLGQMKQRALTRVREYPGFMILDETGIDKAIEQVLNKRDAGIIHAYFIDGMTMKQIGETPEIAQNQETGGIISRSNLSIRIRKGMKKLEECISKVAQYIVFKGDGVIKRDDLYKALREMELGITPEEILDAGQYEQFREAYPVGGDKPIMDDSIEELGLRIKAYNCLKKKDINTIGELTDKLEIELKNIRGFGRKSLYDVKERLGEHGLSLREK